MSFEPCSKDSDELFPSSAYSDFNSSVPAAYVFAFSPTYFDFSQPKCVERTLLPPPFRKVALHGPRTVQANFPRMTR
eukprot:763009-Hanusia_phi.AAC.4